MEAADQQLVKRAEQLVLLFAPPFDVAPVGISGYIKGYLLGFLRENGGQYTHAAIWVLIAQALLGNKERVGELLQMLNPVQRSLTPDAARTYRVEPYVLAGGHLFRRRTVTARRMDLVQLVQPGWFYRAILENALGSQVAGIRRVINPRRLPEWQDFDVALKFECWTDYAVQVRRTRIPAMLRYA